MTVSDELKKLKNISIKRQRNIFESFNFPHWSMTTKIKQHESLHFDIYEVEIFQIYDTFLSCYNRETETGTLLDCGLLGSHNVII